MLREPRWLTDIRSPHRRGWYRNGWTCLCPRRKLLLRLIGVYTCPTAYQKDHYFCRNNGDIRQTIVIVHSRKEIERMSPDDLEGELIVRMFVVQ
jgi:hypothetical protein